MTAPMTTCPTCGGQVQVMADGRLIRHFNLRIDPPRWCAGAMTTIPDAVRITYGRWVAAQTNLGDRAMMGRAFVPGPPMPLRQRAARRAAVTRTYRAFRRACTAAGLDESTVVADLSGGEFAITYTDGRKS
jgi:hypothetical protein